MAARTRLLGRHDEDALLGRALDAAAEQRRAIVVLEGEAGIGKSRLLAEAGGQAQRRGMQVALGRAEELEQSRPFGLLARALGCDPGSEDPRRATIAALLAPREGGGQAPITVSSDPGLQFRVVDAIADLVEELSGGGPVLVGLDDLQWADTPSLLTLAALVRLPADLPLTLVVCVRPVPRSPELTRLLAMMRDAGAQQVSVPALDEAAVTAMVAAATGSRPDRALLAAVARAGGNPLFIGELLTALDDDGLLHRLNDPDGTSRLPLSPTLRLTILRRVGFLPDRTLAALRAASILGSAFTLRALSDTTTQSALDLAAVLTPALRARVIEEDGERLRFRHDLIRDAIYEDLPVTVRRGLHTEAGQRLARAGAPVAQVAEQLSRGAVRGDGEAIRWLVRAARQTAAGSPTVAAELFARALELTAPGDPDAAMLRGEQATCLMWAGQVGDAEAICRTLLAESPDAGAERVGRLCLGLALLVRGEAADAIGELERATASLPADDPDRATALAWASVGRTWLGDLDGAAGAAATARRNAVASDNHHAVTVAMATSAVVASLRARLPEALQIADEAVRRADASPGREGHRYPIHAVRGFVLLELDRLDASRDTIDAGMRISAELGVSWQTHTFQTVRIFERYLAGDWDDTLAEIEASGAFVDGSADPYARRLTLSVLSLIRLHRNDVAGAVAAADAAIGQRLAGQARYRTQWAPWAQALASEATGDIAAGYATLAAVWDDCAELGRELEYPMFGPDLVRLALAVGERRRADGICDAVARVATVNDVPSLAGSALRCRGLLDDDPDALAAAARCYARGPRLLDAALTAEEAGTAHLRHGHLAQGRALIEDALQTYDRLDAARDVLRADATLRTAGVHRGRRGTRNRAAHGWAALTPTEITVADLVAEGFSNPQIARQLYVSHRTVQTHLSHMFTKLDITSRVQLANEVTRRRGAPATTPG